MKRYFISYNFETKKGRGSAFGDVERKKGIYTYCDIDDVRDKIIDTIKSDLKIDDDDVKVVILNWRKYDFSLALWISDIFNKIRGIK
jgi:hypothetical protein